MKVELEDFNLARIMTRHPDLGRIREGSEPSRRRDGVQHAHRRILQIEIRLDIHLSRDGDAVSTEFVHPHRCDGAISMF